MKTNTFYLDPFSPDSGIPEIIYLFAKGVVMHLNELDLEGYTEKLFQETWEEFKDKCKRKLSIHEALGGYHLSLHPASTINLQPIIHYFLEDFLSKSSENPTIPLEIYQLIQDVKNISGEDKMRGDILQLNRIYKEADYYKRNHQEDLASQCIALITSSRYIAVNKYIQDRISEF